MGAPSPALDPCHVRWLLSVQHSRLTRPVSFRITAHTHVHQAVRPPITGGFPLQRLLQASHRATTPQLNSLRVTLLQVLRQLQFSFRLELHQLRLSTHPLTLYLATRRQLPSFSFTNQSSP